MIRRPILLESILGRHVMVRPGSPSELRTLGDVDLITTTAGLACDEIDLLTADDVDAILRAAGR